MSRRTLIAQGVTDADIRRQRRTGDLVRLAAGWYAPPTELDGWPEVAYRARVLAAARRFDGIVSHASAAAIHRLPLGGADLSDVHVIRPGPSGFKSGSGRTRHAGAVDPIFITVVDGVQVTTVGRTVVDFARSQPIKVAAAAMDDALYRRLCTPEDIRRALRSVKQRRGSPKARLVSVLADGRAESPTETTVRLAARDRSLPPMELQFDIYDDLGVFVGRADGGFPELGIVWEYDGQGKYGELLPPGRTLADALRAQQRREDRLVQLGWVVIRVDHTDLPDLGRFFDRLVQALQAAQRYGRRAPAGTYVLRPPLTVW